MAHENCLRSDIVYRMQFCVWGYNDYLELDRIYTRLVKKICRNMQSFPTKPLWMLASDGGLGLQSLIDFTHKSKLNLLLKNINKEDDTGKALQGLVARALRDAGSGGCPMKCDILTSLIEPNWMSSLVTWLSKTGLCIEVQGPSLLLADGIDIETTYQRDLLQTRGIVLAVEDSSSSSLLPLPLRVGQCWALDGKVLEIVGFRQFDAECLEWTPASSLSLGVELSVKTDDNHSKFFFFERYHKLN